MPAAVDISSVDTGPLLAAWEQARAQGLNNRAAAAKLGRTEAELIASGCGRCVTRLLPDALALLRTLPLLGEIKAVVRNRTAVIERAGTVHGIEVNGIGVILVEAEHFEMVCQSAQWKKAFALREETRRGLKLSLQFFNAEGISAAKFFLRPASDIHAFANLAGAFASPDQSAQETVERGVVESSLPLQRPAPAAAGALLAFLQTAVHSRQALTFVSRNPAACLSTSKAIERVKRSEAGGWVNVLDDGLDVHLHEHRIRYLRSVPAAAGDGGWLHWFCDKHAVALSVRCGQGWHTLARAASVPAETEAGPRLPDHPAVGGQPTGGVARCRHRAS
jgi:putative heme degradation protein